MEHPLVFIAKCAILNHNHDSTYAALLHQHEFGDIYKSVSAQNQDGTTVNPTISPNQGAQISNSINSNGISKHH